MAFATNLKTRLVWKPGFELETKDKHAYDEFLSKWKKLRLYQRLRGATWNALLWGNAYMESVDDSDAQWELGNPRPEITALGVGGPRPLKSWRPAKNFYGLKQLDSRTMRVQINPLRFDIETAEPFLEKYIQRRWTGPLGPTMGGVIGSNVEIDFHPEQILHIRFNKITDGVYGYSHMRPSIYAIKGYMVMLQYLPAIISKRADPLLHIRLGGEITGPDEKKSTYLPGKDDFDQWKANIMNRQPGEDIFTDVLTNIEEVFGRSVSSTMQGVSEYITIWKERIYMGLGIPPSLVDIMRPGGEVKFGDIKMEVMEDEIKDYQDQLEFVINEKLVPRLVSGDCEFHFNPITPEDWRANVSPLLDLYKLGVVSGEYLRDRLDMPAEAGQGTMYQPPSPTTPLPPKAEPSSEEVLDFERKKAQIQASAYVTEVRKQGEMGE